MTIDVDALVRVGPLDPIATEFIVLFVLAAVVFLFRWVRHQLSFADALIFGIPVLSSAVIMSMHYFGEHTLKTYWRYHYPMYISLLSYAGLFFSRLIRGRLILAIVFIGISIGWQVVAGRRIHREATRPGRFWADLGRIEDRAAQLIATDWKGPACYELPQTLEYYAAPRLPVVFSLYTRVGYASGGRMWVLFLGDQGKERMPDYCFLMAGLEDLWEKYYGDTGLQLMEELAEGGVRYRLYRVVKP